MRYISTPTDNKISERLNCLLQVLFERRYSRNNGYSGFKQFIRRNSGARLPEICIAIGQL
jgi:hypothetical protein